MKKYSYFIVPIHLMHECATAKIEDDAYVAESKERKILLHILDQGYRWIRTENGNAVLELEKESP